MQVVFSVGIQTAAAVSSHKGSIAGSLKCGDKQQQQQQHLITKRSIAVYSSVGIQTAAAAVASRARNKPNTPLCFFSTNNPKQFLYPFECSRPLCCRRRPTPYTSGTSGRTSRSHKIKEKATQECCCFRFLPPPTFSSAVIAIILSTYSNHTPLEFFLFTCFLDDYTRTTTHPPTRLSREKVLCRFCPSPSWILGGKNNAYQVFDLAFAITTMNRRRHLQLGIIV